MRSNPPGMSWRPRCSPLSNPKRYYSRVDDRYCDETWRAYDMGIGKTKRDNEISRSRRPILGVGPQVGLLQLATQRPPQRRSPCLCAHALNELLPNAIKAGLQLLCVLTQSPEEIHEANHAVLAQIEPVLRGIAVGDVNALPAGVSVINKRMSNDAHCLRLSTTLKRRSRIARSWRAHRRGSP